MNAATRVVSLQFLSRPAPEPCLKTLQSRIENGKFGLVLTGSGSASSGDLTAAPLPRLATLRSNRTQGSKQSIARTEEQTCVGLDLHRDRPLRLPDRRLLQRLRVQVPSPATVILFEHDLCDEIEKASAAYGTSQVLAMPSSSTSVR